MIDNKDILLTDLILSFTNFNTELNDMEDSGRSIEDKFNNSVIPYFETVKGHMKQYLDVCEKEESEMLDC